MKRILLPILCACIAVILAACGAAEEERLTPAETLAVTEAAASTETNTETETETIFAEETAVEETTASGEKNTAETTGAASTDAAVAQGEYSILGAWRCDDLEFPLLMLFGENRKLSLLVGADKTLLEPLPVLERALEGEENGLLTDITRDEDADDFSIYAVNRTFGEGIPELEDMINLDRYYILDKNEDLFVLTQGFYDFSYEVTPDSLTLYDDMWGEDAEAMNLEFVDSNTFRLTSDEDGTMQFVRTAHLDAIMHYLN